MAILPRCGSILCGCLRVLKHYVLYIYVYQVIMSNNVTTSVSEIYSPLIISNNNNNYKWYSLALKYVLTLVFLHRFHYYVK